MDFTVKYILSVGKGEGVKTIFTIMHKQSGLMNDYTKETVISNVDKIDNVEVYGGKLRFTGEIPRLVEVPMPRACKLTPGYNDLDTYCRKHNLMKVLADYNASDKNKLKATEIPRGTGKSVNFKCIECGYEWSTSLLNRTTRDSRRDVVGTGCPSCSAKDGKSPQVITGVNDLETYAKTHHLDYILDEWSEKNNKKPSEVAAKSMFKAIFKCRFCGEEWKTGVYLRTAGVNCPKCSVRNTSISEQFVAVYLRNCLDVEVKNRESVLGYEADILVPSLNLIMEYNGNAWHNTREYHDVKKAKTFIDNGYKMLLIKEYRTEEDKLELEFPCDIAYHIWNSNRYISSRNLADAIDGYLQNTFGIKVERNDRLIQDLIDIATANSRMQTRAVSFASEYPQYIAEWSPRNKVSPTQISPRSGEKYYWFCKKCNHEYQMTADKKATGQGCPYCIGKKVDPEFNSFAKRFPLALRFWDFDNNPGLDPYTQYIGSTVKINLKCPNCGELRRNVTTQSIIVDTARCKKCRMPMNRLSIPSSAAEEYPWVKKIWSKRNKIQPEFVSGGSSLEMEFECYHCKQSWVQPLHYLTHGRVKCPHCGKSIRE